MTRRPALWFLLIAACLAATRPVLAQEIDSGDVSNWAIAPFSGTGYYNVSADRSIFVIAVKPRWTLRELPEQWRPDQKRGVDLLVPLAVGLNRFDFGDIPGIVEFDNFATLSIVPGAYVTIPVSRRWTLRALANLGAGFRLDGDENSLTYRAGIRSRFRFGDSDDNYRWSLLNTLEFSGFRTDTSRSSQVVPFSIAVQLEHRLADMRWKDQPVDLVWHLKATEFLKDLRLNLIGDDELLVGGDVEVGIAIRPEAGFSFQGLKAERIGLGYRRGFNQRESGSSSDNSYEALRLYFHSLFDQ